MTWLTPLTGVYLALAAVPPLLLLYFLKLRRKSQPIASTMLWQRSVEDLQANAPFQRLRYSLLLLLQLIVIALIAAAVAQPRLHTGSRQGGRLVMLIDNSASMTSVDGEDGETRLEAMKELARKRIETMYGGGLFNRSPGETMIIAFSDRAEVMCRFTDSKQRLLAAIDRIPVTHGETRVEQALKLARAFTTNVVNEMGEARRVGESPALELYSDGRIADLGAQVLRGEQMTYFPAGTVEASNVAITAVSVERPYDRPTAVQVFVALANHGTETKVCDVQLSVDGAARAIEAVEVTGAEADPSTGVMLPGRKNLVFTPFPQPRGAVIEIANLHEDALASDNVAQVVVPPPKRLTVLLVAPGGHEMVRAALEGLRLEKLDRVRGAEDYQRLVESGEIDRYDLVVLDNVAVETMPQGRYLVFGPTPPVEGLNPYGEERHQMALEWRDDHPIMRYVHLDNFYVDRFRLLEPADDVQVLAEGSRSPLIVAVSRGALQLVYCPFDPLDSRWPIDRSWVHFMLNAVDHLGHIGQGITTKGFAPGEALATRLPSAAQSIVLTTPEGETIPQDPIDPALWSWGPIRVAGLYTLTWEEPGVEEAGARAFAVNLLSPMEGDVALAPSIRLGQEEVSGVEASDATYTPLWPWALGICLGLLMIEWWIFHRKALI